MTFVHAFSDNHQQLMDAERRRMIAAGIIDPNWRPLYRQGTEALSADELAQRGFHAAADAKRRDEASW